MTLVETLNLPATPERVWHLLAVEGAGLRLTPGLTLGPGGRGAFRIVAGGHSLTYRGYARQHVEEPGRHLTWTLSGKEVRGVGRAHAEVRLRVKPDPEGGSDVRLTVLVEGRGRLAEVEPEELDRAVSSVIGRLRRGLARELAATSEAEAAKAPTPPAGAEASPAASENPWQASDWIEVVPPEDEPERRRLPLGLLAAGTAVVAAAALAYWRRRRS
ncbi:MAG: SRPBCC family protein [Candidatus Dormibacteria bacterium]